MKLRPALSPNIPVVDYQIIPRESRANQVVIVVGTGGYESVMTGILVRGVRPNGIIQLELRAAERCSAHRRVVPRRVHADIDTTCGDGRIVAVGRCSAPSPGPQAPHGNIARIARGCTPVPRITTAKNESFARCGRRPRAGSCAIRHTRRMEQGRGLGGS